MARNCPLTSTLRLDLWTRELTYMAADAAAGSDWKLCRYALYALAACLSTGFEGAPRAVHDANLLPLLTALTDAAEAAGPQGPALRRAVATVVGAGAVPMSDEEHVWWGELLVSWVVGPEGGDESLRIAASSALSGMLRRCCAVGSCVWCPLPCTVCGFVLHVRATPHVC